jgi:small-conductance mechanosensitive channel
VALAVTAIPSFPAGPVATGVLARACGRAPGITCRLAWDLTHSMHAADFTTVYLAGPVRLILKIAFVLLLAALLRLAAQRLIVRLTSRVAAGYSRQGRGRRRGEESVGYFSPDDSQLDDEPPEPADPGAGTAAAADPGAGTGDTTGTGEARTGTGAASADAAAGTQTVEAAREPADVSTARRRVRGERRGQRATALASLLGNAATVTIFSIAAVIILGDLGLNLAPVLASAGVLGIAIGFGAQNLVKDFLAGIFMLLEDQYGVGDTVDMGSVAGTVEAVSLRITRLRDINGVVWHIRNGTIKRAGNETHGWARAVIDFPVPYQVPVAAARSALERAAVGLWQEPGWHEVILDRPEVWGVQDITADTVVIRVAARTSPQGKLDVARELRERLKDALDTGPAPVRLADAVPRQADAVPHQADEPPG